MHGDPALKIIETDTPFSKEAIMKYVIILFIGVILIFSGVEKSSAHEADKIRITILYDNYLSSEGTKTDWGFSCIIEGTEKTILFDTGTKSDILFHNMNLLKKEPKAVELIVISPDHGDHTGGLYSFLDKNNRVSVYFPTSFFGKYTKKVNEKGAKALQVIKPVEVCKDVFLTGEMGIRIKEQSMILDTSKGLVVLTGCAHPGIVSIVKRAKEILDKKIYLVLGGFHLLQESEAEVKDIINAFRKLGVLKVGATHCTGDRAIELFKEAYSQNFVRLGTGKVIEIQEAQ